MVRILFTIACLMLVACANAYPVLWIEEEENAAACLAHPVGPEHNHQAPVADRSITFTVTEGGAAAATLCPGGKYDLVVGFGAEPRRALLTTTTGTLGRATAPCLNRAVSSRQDQPETTFADVLTIPCDNADASAEIKVTSASGSRAAFQTASLTLPINSLAKCPRSTCPPGGAAAVRAANTTATNGALQGAQANDDHDMHDGHDHEGHDHNDQDGHNHTTTPASAAAARSNAGVAAPLSLAVIVLSAVMALLGC